MEMYAGIYVFVCLSSVTCVHVCSEWVQDGIIGKASKMLALEPLSARGTWEPPLKSLNLNPRTNYM